MRALTTTMGSQLDRTGRAFVCAVLALIAVLALSAASATGAGHGRRNASCTWGASSVSAQVVDGRVVSSTPVVTGCTPP